MNPPGEGAEDLPAPSDPPSAPWAYPWRRAPTSGDLTLHLGLCRLLDRCFGEWIDRPTIDRLVRAVLSRRQYPHPLLDPDGGPGPVLQALANRAALTWLLEHRRLAPGTGEYDRLLALTVFGGKYDVACLERGLRALIEAGRVDDFRIIVQYLNLADQRRRTPSAEEIAISVRAVDGSMIAQERISEALVNFYGLMQGLGAGIGTR